jgi:hypothetical protein
VKNSTIVIALTCLLASTFCVQGHADGFRFPKITNPFKKPIESNPTEPARSPQLSGSNLSTTNQPPAREVSSFSLPKLKLPKFEMPSFRFEQTRTPVRTRRPSNRTTISRQSRANYNRRDEPSGFDKFSEGPKRFFDKAK